jgi:outer membrane protein OmpA-like peptidoglycan-associated protein
MPAETIIWHGISDDGELVQAAETYPLLFTITDELGNSVTVRKDINVDILVIKEGDRLKIRISSIYFAPNTADYLTVEEEKAEKNKQTLKRLAEILNKYNQYRIRIEGHAVMVHWENPQRAKQEQEEELIPLSKARAEAVKKALVGYGVAENRMTTEGVGGSQPIVPHSDLENRWKNRRVEFILVK